MAGFQGINESGDITTLGRGGSDTSAVALAAKLNCPCEIYTDVDGVYGIDPRLFPKAKKLKYITYEEMMEMASLGSGIMEARSVEIGMRYKVPIYVGLNSGEKNGTYINGSLIDNAIILEEGDIIQIALVQSFFFLSSDATMPLDHQILPEPQSIKNQKRLLLDFRSRRVWLGDVEILPPLSVPQFRLLHTLNEQQGKVVSRSDLISVIWGDEKAVGVSEQALDALVRRLRDRLSSIDPTHDYLVTVRGHGIRLENESS